jgi:hypothetical protein
MRRSTFTISNRCVRLARALSRVDWAVAGNYWERRAAPAGQLMKKDCNPPRPIGARLSFSRWASNLPPPGLISTIGECNPRCRRRIMDMEEP